MHQTSDCAKSIQCLFAVRNQDLKSLHSATNISYVPISPMALFIALCLGACRASSDGMQSHRFQWHGGGWAWRGLVISTASWEAGIWVKASKRRSFSTTCFEPPEAVCFLPVLLRAMETALLMGEKAKAHHKDDALMTMKCYSNPGQAKRNKSQIGATHPEAPGISKHLRPCCCTFCCEQWGRG